MALPIFLTGLVRANVEMRMTAPGGVGLGASLLAIGELVPIVEAGFEVDAQLIALALEQRVPARSFAGWLPIIRVAMAVTRQLLDDRFSRPRLDEEHLRLVILMIESYLANFIPD